MESDENYEEINEGDDVFSVGSDKKRPADVIEETDENDFMKYDDPAEDVTLNDVTERLPSDSNNMENAFHADDEASSVCLPEEKGSPKSVRSLGEDAIPIDSQMMNEDYIDKENLYKIEADPFYLPGDFPSLPDTFNVDQFPLSYRENSMKEDLCIQFVDNFKRQYRYLYGDRKPLILKPLNECGVEKFVCLTINATKLPFPEVYNWEGAAAFVAEYLTMVPLTPCTDVPSRLMSPSTTLELQKGTSFEYSTLLCSLLIGVGYNAYVVSGYATREVCYMDRTREDCSSIEKTNVPLKETTSQSNKRYTVRPPKDLRSKFELEQVARIEREKAEKIQKIKREREEQELLEEQPRSDPLFGQRVHSWVLVLAGKREIGENFFVEPFTGKSWPTDSLEFLGIESLWNDKNYWVNMQIGLDGMKNLNFDLNNTMLWEFLLPGQENVIVAPPLENRVDFEQVDDETDKKISEKQFNLPKTWTNPIRISLKDFQERDRDGNKEILFRKVRLEKFSQYSNIDSVTSRIHQYEDRMLKKLIKTIETFQHRKDKLVKRIYDPSTEMVAEYFERGRKSHLSEHYFYHDKLKANERNMKFYCKSRVDHLMEIADSERQFVTLYSGRDDNLTKRIVNFAKREKKFGPANEREYLRPFESIIEYYSRNKSVPAHQDIQEITYHIVEERILIYFHTADDNIAADMMELAKAHVNTGSRGGNSVQLARDNCVFFQVDPYRPKMTETDIYQYFTFLLVKEESVKASIRREENEMREILRLRDDEKISNNSEISLFDRVRNENVKKTRIDIERSIEEDKHKIKDEELDYLEPFLLQLNIGNDEEITNEQVEKLYNMCKEDFRQRMINKANLLQSRFEKETESLTKKQQWYQKNQHQMQKTDEDDYLQFCHETTFRITTLEKMLARHKKVSQYKESELEKKLKTDKRLIRRIVIKQ